MLTRFAVLQWRLHPGATASAHHPNASKPPRWKILNFLWLRYFAPTPSPLSDLAAGYEFKSEHTVTNRWTQYPSSLTTHNSPRCTTISERNWMFHCPWKSCCRSNQRRSHWRGRQLFISEYLPNQERGHAYSWALTGPLQITPMLQQPGVPEDQDHRYQNRHRASLKSLRSSSQATPPRQGKLFNCSLDGSFGRTAST